MCVMSFLCLLVYSDVLCLFCLIRGVLYCVGIFLFSFQSFVSCMTLEVMAARNERE